MMRSRIYPWTLLAAAALIAGCGDFWQAPGGGGGGGGGCTTNCSTTSGGFYILNAGATPQVVGYTLVSGVLTAMSGNPFTVTGTPKAMAIAPSGGALYVSTSGGTYLYSIGTGGKLAAPTSVSGQAADAIGVDTTSAWLVEATTISTGVEIDAQPVGAGKGTLQTVKAAVSGAQVEQIAISPDNSKVFIALGAGGTLAIPFNSASNTAPLGTPASPIAVKHGGQALSVAVDYDHRAFFVGETEASSNSGGLRVFDFASSGEVSGSPYASGGLTPNAILPAVNNVYVANSVGASSDGNIAGFTIVVTGSAFSLTAGPTATAGNDPAGIVFENTDTYALAINTGGSPDLEAYTKDTATQGKLDPSIAGTTGASPIAIVASPATK